MISFSLNIDALKKTSFKETYLQVSREKESVLEADIQGFLDMLFCTFFIFLNLTSS